jgi:CheY-like chemotaxis protein
VWNLLSNAIKFTPKGGRVQVALQRVHSHLEIAVSDTGEGIPPAFVAHAFDRFRQADASTTRHQGGLGLGLAIVKQLVELHGGTARVSSDGLGLGSTFTITLPISAIRSSDGDGDGAVDHRHPSVAGPLSRVSIDASVRIAGVKVLVVDDEPDARALVQRLLQECKATVTTAGSASQALGCVMDDCPDVIVSDIGMPGQDGYAFIRQVRALGAGRGGNTPALALTAYARTEDRMRAVMAGFNMHISKPVEPAELITMVASLAGRTAP